MIDLITYIPNVEEFRVEAQANAENNVLDTCQRIGVCENGEYIFDEGGQEIYDSVYDRTVVQFTDTDGNVTEYTPPEMLGQFA